MRTKIALLALSLVAGVASAQMHGRAASPSPVQGGMMTLGPSAAAVTGTVSSVNGNTIAIADGVVTIDTTNAKIVDGPVVAGSLITAVLKSGDVATNAPLPAAVVAVIRTADVTLTGSVTAIDVAHSTLTMLGKNVVVTPSTSFVTPMQGSTTASLASIQPNELLVVEANVSNGALVATRIVVIAPMMQPGVTIHGTVKSIGADRWVISTTARDYTVVVNAQTRIVNNPQVGDTVEVAARVDSSNAYVAIAIMKAPTAGAPPSSLISLYTGSVQSLSSTSLVIRDAAGKETTFVVNNLTKIAPGIGTGAKVTVIASKAADGTLTALGVIPQMM